MGGVERGSALHCAGSASELTFAGERICVGERHWELRIEIRDEEKLVMEVMMRVDVDRKKRESQKR